MSESATWIEAVRARIAAARSTTEGVPAAAIEGAWQGQLDALAAYEGLVEDADGDEAERDALLAEIEALAEALVAAKAAWHAAQTASTSWDTAAGEALGAIATAEGALQWTADVAAAAAWTAGTRARHETLRARARRVQTRVVAVRAGLAGAAPAPEVAQKRLAMASAWTAEADEVVGAWVTLAEEGLAERRAAASAPVGEALAAVAAVPRSGHVHPLPSDGVAAEAMLVGALEALELGDFEAVATGGVHVLARLETAAQVVAEVEQACAAALAAREAHDASMQAFAADRTEVHGRLGALSVAAASLSARASVWAGRAADGEPRAWSAPVGDLAAADGSTWGPVHLTGVAPPVALTTGITEGLALLASLDAAIVAAEAFLPALDAASDDADIAGASAALDAAEAALDVATLNAEEQEPITAHAAAAWHRAVVEDAACRARTLANAASCADVEADVGAMQAAWWAVLPEAFDGGWRASDGERTALVPVIDAPSPWAPDVVSLAEVDADAAPAERAMAERLANAQARLAEVTLGATAARAARSAWDAEVLRSREVLADARRSAKLLLEASRTAAEAHAAALEARRVALAARSDVEAAAGCWAMPAPTAWEAAVMALRDLTASLAARAASFEASAAAVELAPDGPTLDGIVAAMDGAWREDDGAASDAAIGAAAEALRAELDLRAAWSESVEVRRAAVVAVMEAVAPSERGLADAEARWVSERCETHGEAVAWREALVALSSAVTAAQLAVLELGEAWSVLCTPVSTPDAAATDAALAKAEASLVAVQARALEVDIEAEVVLEARSARRAAFAVERDQARAGSDAWASDPSHGFASADPTFAGLVAVWCARASHAWQAVCGFADDAAEVLLAETLTGQDEVAHLADALSGIEDGVARARGHEAVVALALAEASDVEAHAAAVEATAAAVTEAFQAVEAARASTDPRAAAWRAACDTLAAAAGQQAAVHAAVLAVWQDGANAVAIHEALAPLGAAWDAATASVRSAGDAVQAARDVVAAFRSRFDAEVRRALAAAEAAQQLAWQGLAAALDGVAGGADDAEVRALWASTRPSEPWTDAWVAAAEAFAGALDTAAVELRDATSGFLAADRPSEADEAALAAFRAARAAGERVRAARAEALTSARRTWHLASAAADRARAEAEARAQHLDGSRPVVAAASEPLPLLPELWVAGDGSEPYRDAVATREALHLALAAQATAERTLAEARAVVVASAQGRASAADAVASAVDALAEADAWVQDTGFAADAARAHLLAAATAWARAALLAPVGEPDPGPLRWHVSEVVRAREAVLRVRAELASSWDLRDTLVSAIDDGTSAWDAVALALAWSSHHAATAGRYAVVLHEDAEAGEATTASWRAEQSERVARAVVPSPDEEAARLALETWRAARGRTAERTVEPEAVRASEAEAALAAALAHLTELAAAAAAVDGTHAAEAAERAIAAGIEALDAGRSTLVRAVADAEAALADAWASRRAVARERVSRLVEEIRTAAALARRTAEVASADAEALRGQGHVEQAWRALQDAVAGASDALVAIEEAEADLAAADDVLDVEVAARAAEPTVAAAAAAVGVLDEATRGLHEAVRHVLRVAFDGLAAAAGRASDVAARAYEAAIAEAARAMALDAVAQGGDGWVEALAAWREASSARIEGLAPARRAPDLLARTASLAAAESAVAAAESAVAADGARAATSAAALAAATSCAVRIASTRALALAQRVDAVGRAWDAALGEVTAAADDDRGSLQGWTLPVADALVADVDARVAAFNDARTRVSGVLDDCRVTIEEPVEALAALAAAAARADAMGVACDEALAAAAASRAAFEAAAGHAFDDQHVAFAAETVDVEEVRAAWVGRVGAARDAAREVAAGRREPSIVSAMAAFGDAVARADATSEALAAAVPSVALADGRREGVAAIRTLRDLALAWSAACAAHEEAVAAVHAAVAREDHLAAYRAEAASRLGALLDLADERSDELLLTLEAARTQVEGAAEPAIAARWDALVTISDEVPRDLDAVRALGAAIAEGSDEADIDGRYAAAAAAAAAVGARLDAALVALPQVLADHLQAVQTARERLEARMAAGRSAHRVEGLARRVAVARSQMLAATVRDDQMRPTWTRVRGFAEAFESARQRVLDHQALADAALDGVTALSAAASADAAADRAAGVAAWTGVEVARGLRVALSRAAGASLRRRAEARSRQIGLLRAEARRNGVASRLTALERSLARWTAALGLEDETSLGSVHAAIALAREADDVLAQAIARGSVEPADVEDRVAAEAALAECLRDVARAERAWVNAVHAADRQRRARHAHRVERRDAAEDAARRLAEATSADAGRQIRLLERGYALAVRGADAAGQWAWGLDLAEALGEAGRVGEALTLAGALMQAGGGSESAALRLAGLRARLFRRSGDAEAAGSVAADALASLPPSARGPGVAALAWEVGVCLLPRAPAQAADAFRRARDAAEARWERARATLGLAGALAKTGDIDAAFALASQAAGQFTALGDDGSRAAARALSADLLRRQGHLGAASLLARATGGADHAVTARIAARVAVDAGLGARALSALAAVEAPETERRAALAALAGAGEPRDVGSLWAASKVQRVRARAGHHRRGSERSPSEWAAAALTEANG